MVESTDAGFCSWKGWVFVCCTLAKNGLTDAEKQLCSQWSWCFSVQCEPVQRTWVATAGVNPRFDSVVISKVGPSTTGRHQLVIHSVTWQSVLAWSCLCTGWVQLRGLNWGRHSYQYIVRWEMEYRQWKLCWTYTVEIQPPHCSTSTVQPAQWNS